ncbi:MAG: CDP-diacylglycerol--glycerol-3-phosphate 3-phosphatidyltransferase [Lachnospiraceae bacterium]|nr:CDP-diacylglycerol--glycerol-3-phosphate 3-phosphatidyltransferase [Lachnospiraceae bacterium]
MNLPNKLTVLRMVMVPFFVGFILFSQKVQWLKWIALGLFIIASLTDMLDGKIARKYNLITNFGKFMDPLADKLLVCSALICLTDLNVIPSWITIVIIAREFIISGFRLIAAEKGVVIAAGKSGKWKTAVTMVMICFLLCVVNTQGFLSEGAMYAPVSVEGIHPAYWLLYGTGYVLMIIALVLTVVSLVDYLIKNKDVMKDEVD